MQRKNISVAFTLQDQDGTMHPPVDIGHIESQVLPEVFVSVRQFDIRQSSPCVVYLAAQHLDDRLLQAVIGWVDLLLQGKVIQHLLIQQVLEIGQSASSQ